MANLPTYTFDGENIRRVLSAEEVNPNPCDETTLIPFQPMDPKDYFTKALAHELRADVASRIEDAVTNGRGYHDSRLRTACFVLPIRDSDPLRPPVPLGPLDFLSLFEEIGNVV